MLKIDERLSNIRTIDDINRAVEEIEKDGFGAVIYEKKTAEEWVEELADLAATELDDEEGKYLSYVRTVRNNGR